MITRQLLYMCKVSNLSNGSDRLLKWANFIWTSAILTAKCDDQETHKFPILSIDGVCAHGFIFRVKKEGETLFALLEGSLEGVSWILLPSGDHFRNLKYSPLSLLSERRSAAPQYVVAANGVLHLVDDVFRNTTQLLGRLAGRSTVLLPAPARLTGNRRRRSSPRQHLDTKKTIFNGVAKNAGC